MGKQFHLQRCGSTAGCDSRCVAARAAASPEARPPSESPHAGPGQPARVPEARTARLPQPNRTSSETGGTAGSPRPKLRGQGREGRRSSRDGKAVGTGRSWPPSYLGGPRLADSALTDARPKGSAAQRLERVCAGRKGGQGMRRRRDTEREVPGPQGPATFRALRPAARVRRARAPARRDVTAAARPGPHVGLFGSRQATPLPRRLRLRLRQDGGVVRGAVPGLGPRSQAFRRAPFPLRTRISEPGHSLDPGRTARAIVCSRPEPGSCCVGSAARSHISGRWSPRSVSLQVA